MTDTDKLKRLAEAALKHMTAETITDYHASEAAWREFELASTNPKTILALIAERDEAVALLRECYESPMEPWHKVGDFLASIDAKESE